MEAVLDKEKNVLESIAGRFADVDISKAVSAVRRIYLPVPQALFMDVLKFAASELQFTHLCTITGLDSVANFEFLYHISRDDGIVLTLEYKTGREDPVVIPTVLPIYNGATFYERELESLLGIKVEGLPEGRQYPLPDNWPKGEYPLRKDWKPKEKKPMGAEAQNG